MFPRHISLALNPPIRPALRKPYKSLETVCPECAISFATLKVRIFHYAKCLNPLVPQSNVLLLNIGLFQVEELVHISLEDTHLFHLNLEK